MSSEDYDDEGKLRSWLPDGNRPPDHPAERFRQEYPTAEEVTITYDPVPPDARQAFQNIYDAVNAFGERITAAYRIIAEAREAAGIKPGEPFLNFPAAPEPDPPKSERVELLDDLETRLIQGINELYAIRNPMHAQNPDNPEAVRLGGKIDGLLLVRDWLRSYR